MKIYTKTGDQGKTRLVDGRECSKSSLRVETYGAVDELNSFLGLVISEIQSKNLLLPDLKKDLLQIQNQLFTVGSHLACEADQVRKNLPVLNPEWIPQIEKSIDAMTSSLKPLKNFILPGGDPVAAYLHVSRTIARRAERMVVRLLEESGPQAEIELSLIYLNRLSDHLFTAARYANHTLGREDQIWQKP